MCKLRCQEVPLIHVTVTWLVTYYVRSKTKNWPTSRDCRIFYIINDPRLNFLQNIDLIKHVNKHYEKCNNATRLREKRSNLHVLLVMDIKMTDKTCKMAVPASRPFLVSKMISLKTRPVMFL